MSKDGDSLQPLPVLLKDKSAAVPQLRDFMTTPRKLRTPREDDAKKWRALSQVAPR
ncbi:MAG: hypothetical protein RL077_5034 [Verrucomicrobiota bacterium]|jgi:hypothetical protein